MCAELGEYGLEATPQRGRVSWKGDLTSAYRVAISSRITSRVILELAQFPASSDQEFYEQVRRIPWTEHIDLQSTFAARTSGRFPFHGTANFTTQRLKDGIADHFMAKRRRRPSVDRQYPDVQIVAYSRIEEDLAHVSVGIDLGDGSLHRRGYRLAGASLGAPLRETLAAGLLRLAGWPEAYPSRVLVDPFCGSGTLAIEAVAVARRDLPHAHERPWFGQRGWLHHDKRKHADALEQALMWQKQHREGGAGRDIRVVGSDKSSAAVDLARAQARKARVNLHTHFTVNSFHRIHPPAGAPGVLITNPPYGERMGQAQELEPMYTQFGDQLKHHFPGWTAWILAGGTQLLKHVGLRSTQRHIVYNGPIECRFAKYELRALERSTEAGSAHHASSAHQAGSNRSDATLGSPAASRVAFDQNNPFANRLQKSWRRWQSWAKRQGTNAYRIYNRDMPEFPFTVDWYNGRARVEETDRRTEAQMSGPMVAEAANRRKTVLAIVGHVLGLGPEDVTFRVRAKQADHPHQRDDSGEEHWVQEDGVPLLVNLDDYLDTGLFLDDREIRARLKKDAEGLSFLNLFCYTGAATVAAVCGGANRTVSVDLSNTYLDWAKRNLQKNGVQAGAPGSPHQLFREDARQWIQRNQRKHKFDRIFLGPPTWSRSKGMHGDFEIGRDHAKLISQTMNMLSPGGILLFTTNKRDFNLDSELLRAVHAVEVTEQTVPKDFERTQPHRSFEFRHSPG